MSTVNMQVMEMGSLPCIFSVRAIHLIQKVCDHMEHLINPHTPVQSVSRAQIVNMVPM